MVMYKNLKYLVYGDKLNGGLNDGKADRAELHVSICVDTEVRIRLKVRLTSRGLWRGFFMHMFRRECG